ncbi:putative methyltransferase [Gottschalkia purinilytica]|uniref:Putative methyltransferase n=1 Tax=Gottschalkia purinilytica TaxID=1503 RepID=A0A0L0WBY0_GOTPU|nr:tRNA (N6-threonylcarbamoyladenosine(37)-N6)-methyltransferase TrmO [Gottschalkia purinilytica]KNF08964.1 putative methyltransferase [Gottschalkia purinilytica]
MDSMICLNSIGIIHTDFCNLENMPIQPIGEKASQGRIEIFEEFVEGIKDLEEFSHLILIYNFHEAKKTKLTVKPFLDDVERGVFATRSPLRPNHIGISVVEIEKIEDNNIFIKNIDVLDNTPLLDIKPLVPDFDIPKTNIEIGWLDKVSKNAKTKLSDNRFK